MNVLLLNYEYPPVGAGGATAAWHLSRRLAGFGHRVAVLTGALRCRDGTAEEDGVTVIRLKTLRRRPDRSNIPEMLSYLLAARRALPAVTARYGTTHAIVFFSLPCGPLGLYLKRRCGIPYVVSLRGGDVPGAERSIAILHRLLTPLRRRVLAGASAVVANSEGLRTLSEAADPYPVRVIPNGVDTEFFAPAPGRDGPFRMLFVGRFQEQKNLFHLLRSADGARRACDRAMELHLVGDGPLRKKLESYAAGLGLTPVVRWHGWIDRAALCSMYQASSCLLNPSLYEGMPNAVLEAMACGLPVIASRVAGNRDVVSNGVTGLLVDRADEPALANAIARLARDPGLCRDFGENARRTAVERYSWESVARQYEALLRQPADGDPAVRT